MSTMHCSLLSLGCVFGFVPANNQNNLSALRALKIAQRRLRPEVRSKLLSVASARTDASLVPDAWRFVFLDEATSGRCRVVTVAAKASSEHPDTVRAFSSIKSESGASLRAIPQNKLLFDSNRVLERVRGTSKLKGCLSAEYRLSWPQNGRETSWDLSFYDQAAQPMAGFRGDANTGAIKLVEDNVNAD